MERGKRSVAQKIFYGAMDIIEKQVTDAEAIAVFDKAMEMVRPKVEVKSRRVVSPDATPAPVTMPI